MSDFSRCASCSAASKLAYACVSSSRSRVRSRSRSAFARSALCVASSSAPLFVLNSGIGIDTPTTAWLSGTPPVVTRFTPALIVTSGMRRARSSDTAAFERSISARAIRASGESSSCAVSADSGSTGGTASRSPCTASRPSRASPITAFSFSRATSTRPRAVTTSICTPAAATWALVASTGDTLPACARRAARSAERAAIAADSSVT